MASAGPVVGIVVPAYNAGRFVRSTLDSIRSQSFTDWCAVVVDDGSSDDTVDVVRAVVEEDGRVCLIGQANAGPCVARNRGLAALPESVRYVTFMDADDVWLPGVLERLVAVLDASPGHIGVHGLGSFIDATGSSFDVGVFEALGRSRTGCRGGRPRAWPPSEDTCFETVVTKSVMFPPGLLLARADAYRAIGGFDEAMRYAEDWDALIRLTRRGPIVFLDEVILGYRRHDANVGAGDQVAAACAKVRRKAYYSEENSAEHRRIVRDSWRAAQVMDARVRLAAAMSAARHRDVPSVMRAASRLPLVALRWAAGRPTGLDASGRK